MVEDRGRSPLPGASARSSSRTTSGATRKIVWSKRAHRGADLVERLGPRYPDRVGSPERRDLFEEVPPEVLDLGRRGGRGGPPLAPGRRGAQGLRERAPASPP